MAPCAVAAVVGNCWPVFLRFRGGKGVATGFGALLALVPMAVAPAIVVWIVITASFRYVSLASVLAALCVPLGALMLGYPWAVGGGQRAGGRHHHRPSSREYRALTRRHRASTRRAHCVIVAILGAGSWGTALAVHLGRRGVAVQLWARDPAIATGHCRSPPQSVLPGGRRASPAASSPPRIWTRRSGNADVVLLAVPSEFVAQDAQERTGATGRGCRRVGHQGLRSRAPSPHERADRRALPRGAGGRAVWADLRAGGRPRAADGGRASPPPTRPWPRDCAMPGARASSGSTPTATWPAWRSAAP